MRKILFLSVFFSFVCYPIYTEATVRELKKGRELDTPKTFKEANDLPSILQKEKSSKEESDILALAYAYRDKVTYYHIIGDRDSMLYYAHLGDLELNMFKEKTPRLNQKQTESYVILKKSFASSIIESYLSTNKYDLALVYLKKITEGEYLDIKDASLEAQIYYLLGLTYIHSKKAEKALTCFRKAYSLSQEAHNNEPYSYYVYFKGMIHAMMRLNNLEAMIELSDSVYRMIENEQERIGEKSYEYYNIKYAILYETGGTYVKMGDLKKARSFLDEANKILAKNLINAPHKFIHYQIESLYYLASGNYEKALEYIESSLHYARNREGEVGIYNYLQANLIKAQIMRHGGEPKEAYDLLEELYQINDSTNTANFSSQVAEIESIYQVDKIKLEAERNKEAVRKMLYLIIGGALISVLLIYILFNYKMTSKRLKEKNLQLFQKLSELERNDKQIKELKEKEENIQSDSPHAKDPYDELINNLNSYLIDSQAYKEPNISREELALAIGTNRQYLIEAIKEKTGKTYNEYLYSYRLKYAFDLIVSDKERKISEIFLEAGFLSNATFYRTFKEHYGMTPSELRAVL